MKNVSHSKFIQKFYTGTTLKFEIEWDFGNTKTLQQRFDNAVASGESVNWKVTYGSNTSNYGTYTWRFSNSAGTSSKWGTGGTRFSSDDGIWGAASSNLDGNSPGPYLKEQNDAWGHENPNGGDGSCGTYYINGTLYSASNIRNYMYLQ